MKDKLLLARYLLFGFVVICQAIICSVAVWNHSLVHVNQTLQVDVYLIFLGAFGLALIFALMFIELLCSNPFTTRVWFECAWVALLWLMELAGAAAATAMEPDIQCVRQVIAFIHTLCVSQRVLVAFTWICTIILLLYLLFLFFIIVTHQRDDPHIWTSNIRNLFRLTARQCLSSVPSSPSVPGFNKKRGFSGAGPIGIHYPHPIRAAPVLPAYIHRAGLGPEYEIEHFNLVPSPPPPPPRSLHGRAEQMDVESGFLALPEAVPVPPPKPPVPVMLRSEVTRNKQKHHSHHHHHHHDNHQYPHYHDHDNDAIPDSNGNGIPGELPSTIVYSGQQMPPMNGGEVSVVRGTTSLDEAPLPLGDWPRRDIMVLPVQRKTIPPPSSVPPPSSFDFPRRTTLASSGRPADGDGTLLLRHPSQTQQQSPRARRPSGPRLRTASGDIVRPAPLDLSGISNYGVGDGDHDV